ncbi:arylesterase [Ahrensia sp. R2A130]|uniref:arylesterase n=1 Tax=Ahrensia sp. R2A130 TaxID=744979 RepID=UPI0001E09C3E|nr:arylesterase [Ahrensia sp. R2A130]EFL89616.1 putative acyl-coa thioesterase i protein [Ahrensia sp. R2A130]
MTRTMLTRRTMLAFAGAVSLTLSGLAHAQEDVPTIVGFGDSLMAGYQLPATDGFVPKLQAVLDAKGLPAKIVSAGVSGDTTSAGLSRLDWSVPEGTDAVILELGANDALRGLPLAKTRANLDTMISRLRERGIEVLLVGMLAPPNMGKEYGDEFSTIFTDLAAKYELPLYPFFLDGVMAVPGTQLDDGMHPNVRGVEIMVAGILPKVEELIEKLRPTP